ncbi:MAG: hypothetical protein HY236_17160, partial [Acidobacteria bacterium]|nr:hypothetical protein [Acidobacteriota bacterium]
MKAQNQTALMCQRVCRTLGCFALLLLPASLWGQGNSPGNQDTRASLVEDWSTEHVVYSGSDNPDVVKKFKDDPRFQLFKRKQKHDASPTGGANVAPGAADDPGWLVQSLPGGAGRLFATRNAGGNGNGNNKTGSRPQGDWSVSQGGGGAGVPAGMYPAKYVFDLNAAPSCASDFVVFPSGLAGVAPVKASKTGTFTGSGVSGTATINGVVLTATGVSASATGTFSGDAGTGTITITNGLKTLTLTRDTVNSASCTVIGDAASGTFKHEANTTNEATSLRDRINATNCGSNVGVSAASSAAVVTVTATALGSAGNSIALAATV